MARISLDVLCDHFEPSMLRLLALAAMAGAGFIVATDLLHAPVRQSPTAPSLVAPVAAGAGGARSLARVEAAAKTRAEMTDVTLFRRVPMDAGGRKLVVVTGLVYATSKATTPSQSYCYVEAGGISPESQVTVRLALKSGDAPVQPAELSAADAAAIGVPLAALRAAAASCRFL